MTKNKKIRPVVPLYVFTFFWVAYALIFPLYRVADFIICVVIALFFSGISRLIFRTKTIQIEVKQKEPKPLPAKNPPAAAKPVPAVKPEKISYGPEIDAIIAEGALAQKEMGRLYGSIKNPEIKEKISELMRIADKIVDDAIHDPGDVPQIKKFLSYYLPTTIKLLNAYDRMDAQGIAGENISGTMGRIEDMLDTSVASFKKQLDSLFANQALDIETDITVMNAMLKREGLSSEKTF